MNNQCPHSLKTFPGRTSDGARCTNAEVGIRLFSSNNSMSVGFFVSSSTLNEKCEEKSPQFLQGSLAK